jgi:phosphoribosylformylglycinamidine synthase II
MSSNPYVKREDVSFSLIEVDLQNSDKDLLLGISDNLAVGLSLEEMNVLKTHFKKLRRNPTDVELQTFGQTWSEHCFHKTFKGNVVSSDGKMIAKNLFKTYIVGPVRKLKPSWCLDTFQDNAGIVLFEKRRGVAYGVAAKVETHNHPSAVEPFGGAATGTGGVIRDILAVWAKPIACTDVLCFGPLDFDQSRLPKGVNHPTYLFDGVVAGIGSYGNNMGIPTVNGAIFFDESYVGNVVVYCGCIGLVPMEKFVRNTKPGDIALLVGGKTGRDGIHGVTFASTELTEESETTSLSAVQVPNPIEEEKVKRAILEIRDQRLASGITDLGGGGLSCAAGEMAHRSNCGIQVELDKVPLKDTVPPMAPWEIWVSESQERMLLSIPPKNLGRVLRILDDEDAQATPIGRFIEGHNVTVTFQGSPVLRLNLDFLFSPPPTTRTANLNHKQIPEPLLDPPGNLLKTILELLSAPNIASKETVIRTYDHEVQGSTVLKPLQGAFSSPNDAAVLKPLFNSWRGIVISCGMNPSYGKLDPYWMAASAIDEALRNNVAVGGRRVALLDNFTWGSPEKPDRMGSLVKSCQACYDYAKGFGSPFISGKDSLYNESPFGSVTPTFLVTGIGIVPDVRQTVSMELKKQGDLVYLIGATYPELGGSEYFKHRGITGGSVPRVRLPKAKKTLRTVTSAIDKGYVRACHDLSEGGLAIAAAEMAFGNRLGLDINLDYVSSAQGMREDIALFSESNSRFLIEVEPRSRRRFERLMREVPNAEVGKVQGDRHFVVRKGNRELVDVGVDELRAIWKQPFEVK